MEFVTAKRGVARHVTEVFKNLAERSLAELEDADFSVDDAKNLFLDAARDRNLWVVMEKRNCLALLCWRVDGNIAHTSFVGIEDFFSASKVRGCRRILVALQREIGSDLHSISYSRLGEKVEKWFHILGFETIDCGFPKRYRRPKTAL